MITIAFIDHKTLNSELFKLLMSLNFRLDKIIYFVEFTSFKYPIFRWSKTSKIGLLNTFSFHWDRFNFLHIHWFFWNYIPHIIHELIFKFFEL